MAVLHTSGYSVEYMSQDLEDNDGSKAGNGFTEEQDEVPEIIASCDNHDDDSRVLSGIQLARTTGELVSNTLPPKIRKQADRTIFESSSVPDTVNVKAKLS
jgi:hypothetical protein